MKERGILFSAPMVRALLDGSKTQTRRALRDQDPVDLGAARHGVHLAKRPVHDHGTVVGHRMVPVHCPYGVPCDRLWVREAWRAELTFDDVPPRDIPPGSPIAYEADGTDNPIIAAGRYRQARFMPRWAARLMLDVTEIRVQRLCSIGQGDACAEGAPAPIEPLGWFEQLWEEINGPGSWALNPWVWAVSFERLKS